MSSPSPHRHYLRRHDPHRTFVLSADMVKTVHTVSIQVLQQRWKGNRKDEKRQARKFL